MQKSVYIDIYVYIYVYIYIYIYLYIYIYSPIASAACSCIFGNAAVWTVTPAGTRSVWDFGIELLAKGN